MTLFLGGKLTFLSLKDKDSSLKFIFDDDAKTFVAFLCVVNLIYTDQQSEYKKEA
jgi:hypothetical protein